MQASECLDLKPYTDLKYALVDFKYHDERQYHITVV